MTQVLHILFHWNFTTSQRARYYNFTHTHTMRKLRQKQVNCIQLAAVTSDLERIPTYLVNPCSQPLYSTAFFWITQVTRVTGIQRKEKWFATEGNLGKIQPEAKIWDGSWQMNKFLIGREKKMTFQTRREVWEVWKQNNSKFVHPRVT